METEVRLRLVQFVAHPVAEVGLLQMELSSIGTDHLCKLSTGHRVHIGVLQTELPRLIVQLHPVDIIGNVIFLAGQLLLPVVGRPLRKLLRDSWQSGRKTVRASLFGPLRLPFVRSTAHYQARRDSS